MLILKKLPDVVGFYMPGDRRQDYDGLAPDPKTGELVYQPSMTKQSFVAECDINNIVKEYTPQAMAQLTLMNLQAGNFQDLPDASDYQTMLETLRRTDEAFALLPAKIRARFDNDPAQFVEFFNDPANQEEAIKLGLASDLRPPEPSAPPPAPPAPPEPPKGG